MSLVRALDFFEMRVLGALMEKEQTTPEGYREIARADVVHTFWSS